MKKEVDLDWIANFYSDYREKFSECLGRKMEGEERYCALNFVGREWFACPYADSSELIEVIGKYHCRCSYKYDIDDANTSS